MKHIIDPRPLLEGAPPSSPLWALADAFDAATNGMENPEADERLRDEGRVEFAPWKGAIAAIKALYADDPESCHKASESIDKDAPPASLIPLFRAWAVAPAPNRGDLVSKALSEASAAIAELYHRVAVDAHPLGILAEQAEEALRHGMVQHFETLAFRILHELHDNARVDGPFLALKYAERCLELLNAENYEDTDFFSVILRALGRADGFLALGLTLVGRDDEAAAAAFRGALESEEGLFLRGPMRKVVETSALILEREKKAKAAKREDIAPLERKKTASLQLELF